MRFSLEQLQHACNELENRNEIAIIEKYGRIGKYQTTAILSKTLYDYNIFQRMINSSKKLYNTERPFI